ncbi:MAG: hypothetical protein KC449_01050 [Anaerolineales bacterium]|nr:hypothetical protein [Anaerolineales bacterium]
MRNEGYLNCRYCSEKKFVLDIDKYPQAVKHGNREFYCSTTCEQTANKIRDEINSREGLGAIFRCTKYDSIVIDATYRDFIDWLHAHFALAYSNYEQGWHNPRDLQVTPQIAKENFFSYKVYGPQDVIWEITLITPKKLRVCPVTMKIGYSYVNGIKPTLEKIDEHILFLISSIKSDFHWAFQEPEGPEREQWFLYRFRCEQAGIKVPTHKYIGEKIYLTTGTTRNYYNEWKAGMIG